MSINPRETWRPTATREMLQLRARLFAETRRFFGERGVLEVDTPMIVNAPVTDVHLHSATVYFADQQVTGAAAGPAASAAATSLGRPYYLHTSPEYAMKRLLAAGSGDIFQICHVARAFERGRVHNAEFTLVEWYRLKFSLDDLMSEVDGLARTLLGARGTHRRSERISYREAFLRELRLDPFEATLETLVEAARQAGFEPTAASHGDRDELLELLMGTVIGPRLGLDSLTFVHGYPATQAALARLDPRDSRAALRFELYCDGIELANGFHELAVASEQRTRFERDLEERRRLGLPTLPMDERLLAALETGLPECAGVALGFDRTLILAAGVHTIDDVLAFPTERA